MFCKVMTNICSATLYWQLAAALLVTNPVCDDSLTNSHVSESRMFMTRRFAAEHVLRCQEWERKLYASNKCFIWVKSIPICVQSWNSSNLQTNLLRNSKVTCHNFLFPEVLAGGRALDWARINPVIKPWHRMMESDIGWQWGWHLTIITSSLSLHLITGDPAQWPRKWLNLMTRHARNIGDLSLQFSPSVTLICNVTLHRWLAHIVFGMLSINQFASPQGPGAGVVTW